MTVELKGTAGEDTHELHLPTTIGAVSKTLNEACTKQGIIRVYDPWTQKILYIGSDQLPKALISIQEV